MELNPPEPGNWSVKWAVGDVVSWRYDDDGDRIHTKPTAHLFVVHDPDQFDETMAYRLRIDGDDVDVIPYDTPGAVRNKVRDRLLEYAPD